MIERLDLYASTNGTRFRRFRRKYKGIRKRKEKSIRTPTSCLVHAPGGSGSLIFLIRRLAQHATEKERERDGLFFHQFFSPFGHVLPRLSVALIVRTNCSTWLVLSSFAAVPLFTQSNRIGLYSVSSSFCVLLSR